MDTHFWFLKNKIVISIDDTMIEKSGKHFELCSKLYDHAAHNGSNYLNGHCMVSLLLSFPVYQNGKILYLYVPVGYRLWDKEKSRLALAAKLAAQAMIAIGPKRQVILLCDSWYPKAEAAALSDETFSGCQSASAQETRYEIGQQIQSEIILCSFGNCSKPLKIVLSW